MVFTPVHSILLRPLRNRVDTGLGSRRNDQPGRQLAYTLNGCVASIAPSNGRSQRICSKAAFGRNPTDRQQFQFDSQWTSEVPSISRSQGPESCANVFSADRQGRGRSKDETVGQLRRELLKNPPLGLDCEQKCHYAPDERDCRESRKHVPDAEISDNESNHQRTD